MTTNTTVGASAETVRALEQSTKRDAQQLIDPDANSEPESAGAAPGVVVAAAQSGGREGETVAMDEWMNSS